MIDWLTFGEPEQVALRQWTDGFEIENGMSSNNSWRAAKPTAHYAVGYIYIKSIKQYLKKVTN